MFCTVQAAATALVETAVDLFPSAGVQCLATGKLFADSHDHDSIATALAAAVQAHQLEADFISVETFSAAVSLFAEGPPPSAAAVRPTPESLDEALTHAGTLNKIAGVADLFSELSASRVDVKASRAEDRELANLLREVRAGVSVTSTLAAIHMLRCVVCADG